MSSIAARPLVLPERRQGRTHPPAVPLYGAVQLLQVRGGEVVGDHEGEGGPLAQELHAGVAHHPVKKFLAIGENLRIFPAWRVNALIHFPLSFNVDLLLWL